MKLTDTMRKSYLTLKKGFPGSLAFIQSSEYSGSANWSKGLLMMMVLQQGIGLSLVQNSGLINLWKAAGAEASTPREAVIGLSN
jgi:hypothetical protein